MKRSFVLPLFFLLGFIPGSTGLSAQDASLAQEAAALQELTGAAFVEKALVLSEALLEDGKNGSAEAIAARAFATAKQQGMVREMSLALYFQAKALLASGGWLNKAKALKLIKQSSDYAVDREQKLMNLYLLQETALEKGKEKELQLINEQIAKLQYQKTISEAEKKEFTDQLANLETQTKELTETQSGLLEELENKDAALSSMTEEQAKVEVILLQQKSLLDSLSFMAMVDSLKLQQQSMLLEKRSMDLKRRQSERNFFIALGVIVLLLALGLYLRFIGIRSYNRKLENKNDLISEEKKRSEELLLNILPASVAEELKTNGAAKAQHFKMATVLFTDFESFSQLASQLSPEVLVANLDFCFKGFDSIMEKYGLEKIKTIGDAYMCAGGLPQPNETHPNQVIFAALEMQRFLYDWKKRQLALGEPFFEARLGIHSGPLVAGVVGVKKFAYDIWGDTVNIASRVESQGEVGRVNISESTYELIKDHFQCSFRGRFPIKNLGEVGMYFVDGPLTETASR